MTQPVSGFQHRDVRRSDDTDDPRAQCVEPKETARGKSSLDIDWNDGPPMGGMTKSTGTCAPGREQTADLSPTKNQLDQQNWAARTRSQDQPLQDDPMGNAIVGMVAAGVVGGIESGVAGVAARPAAVMGGTASKTAMRELVVPVEMPATAGQMVASGAKHAGEHAALDVAWHEAHELKEHGDELEAARASTPESDPTAEVHGTAGNDEHGRPVPAAVRGIETSTHERSAGMSLPAGASAPGTEQTSCASPQPTYVPSPLLIKG